MKNNKYRYIAILVTISLTTIVVLCVVDITVLSDYRIISKFLSNINIISGFIKNNTPVIILTIFVVVFFWLFTKYNISIGSVTIGGIEFTLKDSEQKIKNNVRNYLNSKRSLFCFDERYDNICEVLNSYYDIYVYLRNQLVEYGNSDIKKDGYYAEVQKMLEELNRFLSKNQSNYRRWNENTKAKSKEKYIDLQKYQSNYPNYNKLLKEFYELNSLMKLHAEKFDIKYICIK